MHWAFFHYLFATYLSIHTHTHSMVSLRSSETTMKNNSMIGTNPILALHCFVPQAPLAVVYFFCAVAGSLTIRKNIFSNRDQLTWEDRAESYESDTVLSSALRVSIYFVHGYFRRHRHHWFFCSIFKVTLVSISHLEMRLWADQARTNAEWASRDTSFFC